VVRARAIRRTSIIGAISFGLWVGVAPDAAACRCFGGPVCIAARLSEVVFIGRASGFGSVVQFEVERAFKGVRPGTMSMTLANGPGNCALSFAAGERYFVYARRHPSTGALMTGMCTRTRPLSDPHTRADLAYFTRRRHHAAELSLLTGVVSDMTIDLHTSIAVPRRPIEGIRITATPQDGGPRRTATTRADGSYEMSGLTAGRWSITARLPARFVPHEPVTVRIRDADACHEADIGVRIDGRISGQLLDEHGLPLRKATVQLAGAAEARAVRLPLRTIDVATNEYGFFDFQHVGPGQYVVGVHLRASLGADTLNRRRFYGESLDPHTATVVALEAGRTAPASTVSVAAASCGQTHYDRRARPQRRCGARDVALPDGRDTRTSPTQWRSTVLSGSLWRVVPDRGRPSIGLSHRPGRKRPHRTG
jgi:hypothetical protein